MKALDGALKKLDTVLDRFCTVTNRIAEWTVGIAVFLIAAIFLWEIFVRFFRIGSLRWALETNRILFILIGFLGSAVAFRRGRHVRFEFLERKLASRRAQVALSLVTSLSALLFGLILMKEGYASALTQLNAFLPATRLSRAWLFAPIPISGLLVAIYALHEIVRTGLGLRRPAPSPNPGRDG